MSSVEQDYEQAYEDYRYQSQLFAANKTQLFVRKDDEYFLGDLIFVVHSNPLKGIYTNVSVHLDWGCQTEQISEVKNYTLGFALNSNAPLILDEGWDNEWAETFAKGYITALFPAEFGSKPVVVSKRYVKLVQSC